ncbi:MAG: NAD(P)/FAD-dependent oxidoreductase, partial [Candidatus Binatia bacterium]
MTKPDEISPWMAGADEPTSPLGGEVEADVAVIGAGYAGLSAALELRAEGLSVAVLEARYAGFGASGRNAGHLTPTIGKDLPTLTRIFGRERVRGLVQLADTAIRYVEQRIAGLGIDCQYEPVGNVIAAVHPRQFAALDRAAQAAADFAVPGALLEPAAMRRRGLPSRFQRGFLEPHGGILHPGHYARGLRRAALAAGVALYEQTPVRRVDAGPTATLLTDGGRVRARRVVVATNAYTPQLGLLRWRVLPMYVQLFRTSPLSDAQLAAVDWHGREGIYTAHEMLESYRLTRDNRIVGGAKYVRYGYGGTVFAAPDTRLAAGLESVFRVRFPELGGLRVENHWGGPIALSLDFLPVIQPDRRHANMVYAVGYAGHGVAQASYAGRLVADLFLERDSPGAALWTRRRLPLPPEPLRWLTVRALTGLFGAIDRRVDAAV